MAACYLILTSIILILIFIYRKITKYNDYWKKRNVPYLKPSLLFGNYKEYILLRKCLPKVTQGICQEFPDEPYVGVFYGTDPALVIKDPNLLKLIMTKDFYYFNEREISEYADKEPTTQNMFFKGGDIWKVLHQNSSTIFSSSKMKNIFFLIEACANSLENVLNKEMHKQNIVDIKSLLERYTMDCIGSCAFGVNIDTLENSSPSNPFIAISEKVIDVSTFGGFKMVCRAMWPAIFYGLGLRLYATDVEKFFRELLIEVFESRKYKQSTRNDLVDQILSWKKNKYISGDCLSNAITGNKKTINIEADDNLLLGQCLLFFAAGFETTSTTLSFLLYELAKNKNAEYRVQKEIDDYYKRYDDKIDFESINETPFLQACVDETLRLYPPLGVLAREVTEHYTLPTGLRLEKGTRIHIPVYHLHHNPEYFPEPEVFRPERFLGEEKKNVKPYTYMPFGEGPRTCIGLRFAKMPITAGILTVLKNHSVELSEGMPRKVEFQPRYSSLVIRAITDINLKFTRRK